MLSWLPSMSYAPAREDGFWSPVTSTLDWCEENYYATTYSAEIVNTLTNVLFVYLAVKGMHNCYKHGHDRIYFLIFVGLLVVGSGSAAFHTTLKYPMQLVDEIGMIWATCLMMWAVFEHKRSLPIKWILGILIAGLALFITGYYHYLQDPSFHQNAYAILTALVLLRALVVMELNLRPYFKARRGRGAPGQFSVQVSEAEKREERRQDDRDRKILGHMWVMVLYVVSAFLIGFTIWSIDNIYCSTLRRWRREVGLPWGILLEGHGWWHLFTGLGAYSYIVWGVWLRQCLNGRQDEYEMVWPSIFTSVPVIVRRQPVSNGDAMDGGNYKAD